MKQYVIFQFGTLVATIVGGIVTICNDEKRDPLIMLAILAIAFVLQLFLFFPTSTVVATEQPTVTQGKQLLLLIFSSMISPLLFFVFMNSAPDVTSRIGIPIPVVLLLLLFLHGFSAHINCGET